MSWLPAQFAVPDRLDVPTGHHLRPIRATDVDIDYPAVMGSRDSLWARYGQVWGWPPADMSYEADRADLARHENEMAAREAFNFAILDHDEDRLLGCLYIDPCPDEGVGAEASWWVIDAERGGELDVALAELIPRWLDEVWPFDEVRHGP